MTYGLKQEGGLLIGKLFWLYWFPLIVYCLAIFIQSSYPSPEHLPVFPMGDKMMHFAAYAVMGGLFFRALKKTRPSWRPTRVVFFGVLFTTLYGVGDEIHQLFVMSRTADQMDVLADFLGGTFGAVISYVVTGFLGRHGDGDRSSEIGDQRSSPPKRQRAEMLKNGREAGGKINKGRIP